MKPDYASLCVLSYNRPQFLHDCLRTIHAHAGAPFELIVHDDGSADPDVQRILHSLLHAGMISTLITNPPGHNQGQGTALNRMFRIATGDPIIKLDQDLLFEPDWLAKTQAILKGNRERDRIKRVLAHQPRPEPLIGLLGLLHYHHDPVASIKTKLADHSGWSEHTHILGSAFAVTRDCWRDLGPFEEHSEAFAEDWVFQRKVTDSAGHPKSYDENNSEGRRLGPKGYVCGLPPEDLCTNQGFGVGPSTVVVAEGTVASIHKEPVIHGRDDAAR